MIPNQRSFLLPRLAAEKTEASLLLPLSSRLADHVVLEEIVKSRFLQAANKLILALSERRCRSVKVPVVFGQL